MKINFYEEPHIYTLDGQIAGTSVTRLLQKHKLAPSYSGLAPAFLQPYAERGKIIHQDLEAVATCPETYLPETNEGITFRNFFTANILRAIPEQLLGIDWKGLYICGTADIIGTLKNGIQFVGDHKTTSTIHVRAVTWQVNIYDYMIRHADEINGLDFKQELGWHGADEFYCFHFTKDGTMEIKKLKKIPDKQIEDLFDKELEEYDI